MELKAARWSTPIAPIKDVQDPLETTQFRISRGMASHVIAAMNAWRQTLLHRIARALQWSGHLAFQLLWVSRPLQLPASSRRGYTHELQIRSWPGNPTDRRCELRVPARTVDGL